MFTYTETESNEDKHCYVSKQPENLDVCREGLARATIEQYLAAGGEAADDSFRVDPIESDPAYAAILLRASLQAEREVGPGRYEGHCHDFWAAKKRTLWQDYRVRRRSPAQLNSDCEVD